MRKLKLQVQTTVNGFIAGPNGEMDWTSFQWDEALKRFVGNITDDVDCIVLGRKLAEGFIPYWNSHPKEEGAHTFIHTPKVVFSKTLAESPWDGTVIAKGDLAGEINALKRQPGKNLVAYGGAQFVSALIKFNLVDENFLFVNPAAIPSGKTIFGELDATRSLKLVDATRFECGVAVLKYVPA